MTFDNWWGDQGFLKDNDSIGYAIASEAYHAGLTRAAEIAQEGVEYFTKLRETAASDYAKHDYYFHIVRAYEMVEAKIRKEAENDLL